MPKFLSRTFILKMSGHLRWEVRNKVERRREFILEQLTSISSFAITQEDTQLPSDTNPIHLETHGTNTVHVLVRGTSPKGHS